MSLILTVPEEEKVIKTDAESVYEDWPWGSMDSPPVWHDPAEDPYGIRTVKSQIADPNLTLQLQENNLRLILVAVPNKYLMSEKERKEMPDINLILRARCDYCQNTEDFEFVEELAETDPCSPALEFMDNLSMGSWCDGKFGFVCPECIAYQDPMEESIL